jgi:hypothetical protein
MKNINVDLEVHNFPGCCGARIIYGFENSSFIVEKNDKEWPIAKEHGYKLGNVVRADSAYSIFKEEIPAVREEIHKVLFEKMRLLYKQGVKVVFVATTVEQLNANAVLEKQGFYTMDPYNRIIGWMVTLNEWAKHNEVE